MRDLRGLVGWPGGFTGGRGGGDRRGRGSLGSGATRTWPPPWPLLGLPPPGTERTEQGQTLRRPTQASNPVVWREGGGGFPHLVGLGLAVLRVVLLVCLCLGVLLCLLGLLVLLLVVHSLFFLRGGQNTVAICFVVDRSHSGWGGSLTFAAFLAFGSGLGWAGFYDNNGKESSIYCTSASLLNNRQFSHLPLIIGIIATFSPV